jgi:hypothetical protein
MSDPSESPIISFHCKFEGEEFSAKGSADEVEIQLYAWLEGLPDRKKAKEPAQ